MILTIVLLQPLLLIVFFCCLELTFRDRMFALNRIFEHLRNDRSRSMEYWGRTIAMFRGVSYNAHLFRRLTFRNPWVIYPQEIRDIVGRR